MISCRFCIFDDAVLQMPRISLEPSEELQWLELFISDCSFVEICDFVLHAVEHSLVNNHPWYYLLNEVALDYSPTTQMVSASFLCGDLHTSSKMRGTDFLTIFREWRATIDRAGRHRPFIPLGASELDYWESQKKNQKSE